jgi:hypothetical protein
MTEAELRTDRDTRLAATDWTQSPDAPLTENERARYREYRQKLRDVPKQATFPDSVDWPSVPEKDTELPTGEVL